MKLCHDGASLRIQDKWHYSGMLWQVSHVDGSLRSQLPLWDLLSIAKRIVQHIYWASPNMTVMKLLLLPSHLCEQIHRRNSGFQMWHVIIQLCCMCNCHWPLSGISCIKPM
jgi:hypothetical protein